MLVLGNSFVGMPEDKNSHFYGLCSRYGNHLKEKTMITEPFLPQEREK